METTMDVEMKTVSEDSVLEKAHTLVGNRRSLLSDLQKALGELRLFAKEMEAAERQCDVDHEEAAAEERKTIAALDAELEAAKKQHAQKCEEARQVYARAMNQSKSRLGMARSRHATALDVYQKLKRNLAKLLTELPA